MHIFIQHNGQQTGPFPLDQVRAGLANGTYQPSDLAWHEGAPEWMPLSAIPGINETAPPSLPGTVPPAGAAPQTCALAVWSLVLGLLSMVLLGLTAIPAIVCGHLALGKIKRSAGTLTGGGLAIAGLVIGYVFAVIFVIALLAGLAAPLIFESTKKGNRSEATQNLKQIGLALFAFEEDFGTYPSAATAAVVADTSKTETITGNSSNAYFRQLIRAGMIDSERPFYARTKNSRRPDNVMDGSHLLEAGECAFAYISNTTSEGDPRPIAMTPFLPGTTRFDPKPFDGKAVVLWTDNSVQVLPIDRRTGELMLDGRNLLDPAHPVWAGTPPVIALPE